MAEDEASNVEIQKENAPELEELTWGHIKTRFFENLKLENKGKQERNFKTAIKFFLEAISLTEESPVGTELTEEFEAKIELYIKFQKSRKARESTYKPRVSKIRSLKNFVDHNFGQRLHLQTLPRTFGKRLHKLIVASGLTIKNFWRTLPKGTVAYGSLVAWCREIYLPSRKSLKALEKVETYLRVPKGTLSPPKYIRRGQYLEFWKSDSGNKIYAAMAKTYTVWTKSLEDEFQGLFAHKTRAILLEGEERHESGQWTKSEGGEEVSTARIVKALLQSFMGYCALPTDSADPYLKGAGIQMEHLSLALLADKELVENFLEFRRLRSGLRVRPNKGQALVNMPAYKITDDKHWEFYNKGGKYNRGSIVNLNTIASLLHPGTGYLYQHPEFAEKLKCGMTIQSWQEQCANTWVRVEKLIKQITKMKIECDSENYEFGRDPKERIQWILALPRPFLILHEMIRAMLDELLPESVSMLDRAIQYRNLILVALLCANPLRIRMFSIMQFDKHLIRQSDGSWWLRFKRGEFKNRKALKSDYEVRVAEQIWPLLDRYKEEFHPYLAGTSGTKYVFIGTSIGRHKRYQAHQLTRNTLSTIIHKLTELYIPGGVGFRPHAFRHIIATDIIKKDPRLGFYLASKALHDKLETVEREYVHLKTSEFFEPVNTHFSEMWNLVFES